MIIRDHMRFGEATEPTERKRSYVVPDSFGFCGEPTEHKRTYVVPDSFGFCGDDPEPAWRLGPGKRLVIREVDGRLKVVECE
jgi:hypothetical protein